MSFLTRGSRTARPPALRPTNGKSTRAAGEKAHFGGLRRHSAAPTSWHSRALATQPDKDLSSPVLAPDRGHRVSPIWMHSLPGTRAPAAEGSPGRSLPDPRPPRSPCRPGRALLGAAAGPRPLPAPPLQAHTPRGPRPRSRRGGAAWCPASPSDSAPAAPSRAQIPTRVPQRGPDSRRLLGRRRRRRRQ